MTNPCLSFPLFHSHKLSHSHKLLLHHPCPHSFPSPYSTPTPSAGSNAEGYKITQEFVMAMLEEFKAQRVVHRRFAFEIILAAQAMFKAMPSLVDIPVADVGGCVLVGCLMLYDA